MPLQMDSLLRGIKQFGSGLKFTMDKEISSTPAYTAYKGRYKDFKVTVFRYRGEMAGQAAEGYPLLKHITHRVLAKVHTSQRTGGSFYLVTERVTPLGREDSVQEAFVGFLMQQVGECNAKTQSEHSIQLASLGAERVERSEAYFTAEGRAVIAGVLPRFVQSPAEPRPEGSEESREIARLDGLVERYAALSRSEQQVAHELIRECTGLLPRRYAEYIGGTLVKAMEGGSEDSEQKLQSAKAVLLLKSETPAVALLFAVKYPQVRILALKHLQERKKQLDAELVTRIFPELHSGLLCTDEQVRKETLGALPCLVSLMSTKQKAKLLTGVGGLLKKGKPAEKDNASGLVLKEYAEFLESPELLYSCMGWMVHSSEVAVKRNGLCLIEKLKHLISIRTLVLEIIPLVSTQSVFIEVAEQAVILLGALAERARSEVAQLKASDTWKVPVIGMMSKTAPLKIDQKTVQKIKEQKEKEKNCWDDQEW